MDADRIVLGQTLAIPPNALAGLASLSACEGTGGPDGYRVLYGWQPGNDARLFTSYADHPRVRCWIKSGDKVEPGETFGPTDTTTAAGKYQITAPTYDRLQRKFPGRWRGFTPEVQDGQALELIDECRATAPLLAGDLHTFCRLCAPVWASLPYATAGQPVRSFDYFANAFTLNGGTLA